MTRGGAPVCVESYIDPVEAELACAALVADGIAAYVRPGASFYPLLTDAAGGYRVEAPERDVPRARELLRALQRAAQRRHDDDSDDDEANTGAPDVRCPRCEGSYCFFERPRLRRRGPAVGASALALGVNALLGLGAKRWVCRSCNHTWADSEDGPRHPTRLPRGEPHPVFRLRRSNGGAGLFVGGIVGFLLAIVMQGSVVAVVLFGGSTLIGWCVGRTLGHDLCSKAECRVPLGADRVECPGCGGIIAGRVARSAEHHTAAADYRREFVATLEAAARKRARRKKRRARGAAPAPTSP